jgi:hypothetical protein
MRRAMLIVAMLVIAACDQRVPSADERVRLRAELMPGFAEEVVYEPPPSRYVRAIERYELDHPVLPTPDEPCAPIGFRQHNDDSNVREVVCASGERFVVRGGRALFRSEVLNPPVVRLEGSGRGIAQDLEALKTRERMRDLAGLLGDYVDQEITAVVGGDLRERCDEVYSQLYLGRAMVSETACPMGESYLLTGTSEASSLGGSPVVAQAVDAAEREERENLRWMEAAGVPVRAAYDTMDERFADCKNSSYARYIITGPDPTTHTVYCVRFQEHHAYSVDADGTAHEIELNDFEPPPDGGLSLRERDARIQRLVAEATAANEAHLASPGGRRVVGDRWSNGPPPVPGVWPQDPRFTVCARLRHGEYTLPDPGPRDPYPRGYLVVCERERAPGREYFISVDGEFAYLD